MVMFVGYPSAIRSVSGSGEPTLVAEVALRIPCASRVEHLPPGRHAVPRIAGCEASVRRRSIVVDADVHRADQPKCKRQDLCGVDRDAFQVSGSLQCFERRSL